MKKILVVLLPVILLSGCASLLKTMGAATIADEQARADSQAAEIATLRQTVEALQAKSAEVDALTASVGELKASVEQAAAQSDKIDELAAAAESAKATAETVEELKSATATLPAATLKRLAEIIDRSLEETPVETPKEPAAP